MLRRARSLAAVLALGLASAVALAWGLALLRKVPMYPAVPPPVSMIEHDGRGLTARVHTLWGITDVWWLDLAVDDAASTPAELVKSARVRAESDGRSLVDPPRWGAPRDMPPPGCDIWADLAYGWPLRCAWLRVESTVVGSTLVGDRLVGGVRIWGMPSARGRDFRALPLRPIWTGLLVNSLVFGVAWLAMIRIARAARIRGRRQRGLCTRCAYDRRGLAPGSPCPECGLGG